MEKDWLGVRVGRPIPKMGQRSSNTAGLKLECVWVPGSNVIAPPDECPYCFFPKTAFKRAGEEV